MRILFAAFLAAACPVASAASDEPPPIEAFARIPYMRNVTISPDGTRIAFITSAVDREVAVTLPLASPDKLQSLVGSDPERFELSWCRWANRTRLLCGLRMMVTDMGQVLPMTRLTGVDADGANLKVLIQNSSHGAAQFQDRILDWLPDRPDAVLVQLDEDRSGFPSVFELDVNTGRQRLVQRERPPIRSFTTDGTGNVRLGTGFRDRGTDVLYLARLQGEREWRELAKIAAFREGDGLRPIAIAAREQGGNKAFAVGDYEGRSALWEMDLEDRNPPQLVFSHPLVDADTPLLLEDGRMLGILYETDRPFIFYTDMDVRALMRAINKLLPDTFNAITDLTPDGQNYVIRSYSDVDGGSYYVYQTQSNKLLRLGTAYPELDPKRLGRMRSIEYPAADGTQIPGYLTVPPGVRAEGLPLVVMPHGGPIHRDSWEFDFLRAFLVSRGYAVLQMNFRGSSGYGGQWFHAAHQDWGGLTYSDITDGARWAVAQGIADPRRMCIVGWSFGGYAALLGAVRNGDLYRCSASIAGVSDLHLLLSEARMFIGSQFVREQVGTGRQKLREDSPLRHVARIGMPLLLVHGDKDYQVEISHSRKMASALKRANKPHRAVFIKGASHQLSRQSDRVTLLAELEAFLAEHLGPGVTASAE